MLCLMYALEQHDLFCTQVDDVILWGAFEGQRMHIGELGLIKINPPPSRICGDS